MWTPKKLTTQKKQLDLGSSGLSSISVNELYADDILISNGIEINNWDDESIQLIICDHCASVQCNSGNWVTFRRVGELVMLMPCFEKMIQGDWGYDEYHPPSFMDRLGTISLTVQLFDQLRRLAPSIPPAHEIKLLRFTELAWLIQWEAPQKALGHFSAPIKFSNKTFFIGTNQEDDEQAIKILNDVLNNSANSKETIQLKPLSNNSDVASFYFDELNFVEWQPMQLIDETWELVLIFGYQIS